MTGPPGAARQARPSRPGLPSPRRLLEALLALVQALGEALLTLLAPTCCASCDEPIARHTAFCPSCANSLVPLDVLEQPAGPKDFGGTPRIVAFGAYGGALRDALRRFKYQARPDLARPLAELGRRAARQAGLRAELVVPVPLHPRRLGERGFNQAALLARLVAVEVGGQMLPRALRRVRATAPQAGLDRAARRRNVLGAFVARDPTLVRGRSVLLVDDVTTTGATLEDCVRALREAGAREVTALVVARAIQEP